MAEKTLLDLRLDAIATAQQRARSAFFVAIIAAAVVLIVVFDTSPLTQVGQPGDFNWSVSSIERSAQYESWKESIKQYRDRFYYSLPILGVKVATDDMALFGPLALLVVAVYYAACVRSTLSQLVELKSTSSKIANGDDQERIVVGLKSQIVLNQEVQDSDQGPLLSTARVYRILMFLPVIASASALLGDAWGTFFSHSDPSGLTWWGNAGLDQQIREVLFEVAGALITFLVGVYCYQASTDSRDIRLAVGTLIRRRDESLVANQTPTPSSTDQEVKKQSSS